MALEAARQLQLSTKPASSNFELSNVVFHDPLSLDRFETPDAVVETHFLCTRKDCEHEIEFSIYSVGTANQPQWTCHCSGKLRCNIDQDIDVDSDNKLPVTGHDSFLIEKAHVLGYQIDAGIRALRISRNGSSGSFDGIHENHENYPFKPEILESILYLPPISLSGETLPMQSGISYITSMAVSAKESTLDDGQFAVRTSPLGAPRGDSDFVISSKSLLMTLSGVSYRFRKQIPPQNVHKSLFFKPVILPDITKTKDIKDLSVEKFIELITHKWPMCDVHIWKLDEHLSDLILRLLGPENPQAKFRCRSIQILGKAAKYKSRHILYVDEFRKYPKAHVAFCSGGHDFNKVESMLQPGGFLCSFNTDAEDIKSCQDSYEVMSTFDGPENCTCTLWRLREKEGPALVSVDTVVFASIDHGCSFSGILPATERVLLKPDSIKKFLESSAERRFHAIVIDNSDKSVITSWSGNELLPWFQELLKFAESVLWVTRRDSCTPFQNIAGALLRSLQAEQPSLKVTWLLLPSQGENDAEAETAWTEKTICMTQQSLIKGESEIRQDIQDNQVRVLRYVPDYGLDAATGLALPTHINTELGNADYTLSFAIPGSPSILSYNSPVSVENNPMMEILVQASVIDRIDMLEFRGIRHHELFSAKPIKFFAGKVLSKGSEKYPYQSNVVGWSHNVHQKGLRVSTKQVYSYEELTPTKAASEFAVAVTATYIIDDVVRAREGDIFSFEMKGLLKEALCFASKEFDVSVVESIECEFAHFVVKTDSTGMILVNGKPLDRGMMLCYLQSARGVGQIERIWGKRRTYKSPKCVFGLAAIEQACTLQMDPFSSIISHMDAPRLRHHVPIYRARKFSLASIGAYIVIGGLGGLGRFVCCWLIDSGAKDIVAISRSGISSPEAEKTYATINSTGSSMQVIKADACDRRAMSTILSQVRQTRKIKGVINLAMVLADAPTATMKGEEWDRVLSVKVDSSWILHEETLQDSLDIFILFSSVASVLANRNQVNYNVGNTFMNALAEYRHSLGLPAVSIALGAMSKSCLYQFRTQSSVHDSS